MKHYLAIDIGASSGRHIVGWMDEGKLHTQEVYRFSNGMYRQDGKLVWDIDHILNEVKIGIQAAISIFVTIESLSIDTWGVDYVLIDNDKPIYPCFAYRDERTQDIIPVVNARIPFERLYSLTGIQHQAFNTLYQLYDDKLAGRLDHATDFLMIPEYLTWRLTGIMKKEYTNATTTGLVNARTKRFDEQIITALDLPERLFTQLSEPGEVVGALLPEIASEVGGQTKVVLCATHDTASAVEGIPMKDASIYLSSGTWSLLGVKLDEPLTNDQSLYSNFTNEGGVGYIRYLKNIMGLWIIQCLKKQMDLSFDQMVSLARKSDFVEIFDVNDNRFSAPADMRREILATLSVNPETDADIINCVYHSLAASYSRAISELESNTGRTYTTLYVAGGGAKNRYLDELTRRYTGKDVISLPIEATAIGNLRIQMEADK